MVARHTPHCTRATVIRGSFHRLPGPWCRHAMLLPWLVGVFGCTATPLRAQGEQSKSSTRHPPQSFSIGFPDESASADQPTLEGQQGDNLSDRSKALSLSVESPGAIVPPMDPNAPPYGTYAAPGWGAYAPWYPYSTWGWPHGASNWPYTYWPHTPHHAHPWRYLPRGSQFYFGYGYGTTPRPQVPYGYRYPGYGYPGHGSQYPGYPGYRGSPRSSYPGYPYGHGYPRGTAPPYPGTYPGYGHPPGYGYPRYPGAPGNYPSYPPVYRSAPPARSAPPPRQAPPRATPQPRGAARPYQW